MIFKFTLFLNIMQNNNGYYYFCPNTNQSIMKRALTIITFTTFCSFGYAQNATAPTPKPAFERIINRVPVFKGGGHAAFNEYLIKTLSPDAFVTGENGKMIVSFTVETNGTTSNVKIIQGIEKRLNLAVIEAIKNSPKWTPAYKEGKPTQTKVRLPLQF